MCLSACFVLWGSFVSCVQGSVEGVCLTTTASVQLLSFWSCFNSWFCDSCVATLVWWMAAGICVPSLLSGGGVWRGLAAAGCDAPGELATAARTHIAQGPVSRGASVSPTPRPAQAAVRRRSLAQQLCPRVRSLHSPELEVNCCGLE